ncbi:uncharacterized protein PHACADRAFT_25192 [Phanerochaete carnosa HHB-10118-sp]|uniref:Uncharacterized protein n=1 Tax=Phanerochaete carnosa (strain HHB-10118-sp) TaxID=650164 RepID=K5W582_PHACS|nr:uncharacterized protein PHACADRAFT_25192 [Phanerochaete carnosa HHB-10118-sp]EKM59068.1 hypothetical protein PHACADRAFT_25192 [Phanerochaete carnosa HHB-10118-sp]
MSHDRPLFRGHPLQSIAAAAGAALVAIGLARAIPAATHLHQDFYSLTQTTVAVLALACMAFLVVMHHRQDGRFLSQTQEELILIVGFGLLCLAVVVASRAYREQPVGIGRASGAGVGSSRKEAGVTGGKRPYPCSNDAVACVVEEWSWF